MSIVLPVAGTMAAAAAQRVIVQGVGISDSGSSVAGTLSVNSDGSASATPPNQDWEWLRIGSNSDYDVRLSKTSGTDPSGSALGSWLNLGTSRSWGWSASGGASALFEGTLEIRQSSTGDVLDDGEVTVSLVSI